MTARIWTSNDASGLEGGDRRRALARLIVIVGGLVALVWGRWLATRAGADPVLIGAAFGAGLLGLAGAARRAHVARRVARPTTVMRLPAALAAGGIVGLGLVGLALVPRWLGIAGVVVPTTPAAPFAAWASVIVLVAVAEEAVLRGVLVDQLGAAGLGPLIAIGVAAVAFALLHVPLYGWQVVPLDLAVGLVLGGLRLATGGVAAPAAAHAVADLATWWL